MHADCIKKVAEAAKRTLSQAKIKAIDEALNAKMRELARQDPQGWQAKSMDQRVAEATKSAMDDISAEGARTEKLAQLQAIKTAETNQRIERAQTMTGRKLSRSQALVRDIENSKDYVDSVRDQSVSTLGAMIDAASSKDGTGILRNLAMRIWDLDNPQMTRDVVAEVFKQADGHTGNKAAQAGARAWLDTIEAMRVRFNAAGGNVGKLDYGYLSQQHDSAKILRAGPQEWARKVLPLLDRNNYRNADGSLMKDAEVLPMLEKAHATLSSNGLNKVDPGQFKGSGKRANSGADHRVLHFKDGDAWIAYMKEFGEGSLYDAMLGHVGSMARNIGLVELWGPNPEQNFRVQADIAQRADGVGTKANRALGNTPEAYWNILSGKTGMPENPRIAEAAQAARNIQTAAKLGGAVISSLTDVGTIAHTLHYDRLPYFQMLKNVAKNLDKDHKEFLQAHGVIAEHLTSTLNRWTGDYLTNGLTGRVAQSVMKLSFMNAWTDGLRGAFSATMMQSFAKKVGKDWSKLDEWDRWLMGRKGITEQDWNIISQAKPTEHGGLGYLTRDSIVATKADGAEQAATRWMAFVSDEAQFAIINPDMATRAIVTGGGQPAGTIRGEAARTFMQFKSFPLAMMTRHWGRIFDTPQGLQGAPSGFGAKTAKGARVNQIAVMAGLNVSLMMLGAVVLQTKAIVQGKDPYDMTDEKFWPRALSQGGGMGYVGDFIFKDPTEQRGSNAEQTYGSVLGPTAGAAAGLAGDLVLTNAWEAAKGKDTHAGAEALRWTTSQLPYVGMWQTRAVFQREFLDHAQEAVNPGYLGRVKARAKKDWNQDYWWAPGERIPDRAPDISKAAGG